MLLSANHHRLMQDIVRALLAERAFDTTHPLIVHLHDTDDARIISRAQSGADWGPVIAIRELPAQGEPWDVEAVARAMLTDAFEDAGAREQAERRQARNHENAVIREEIEDARSRRTRPGPRP